MMMLNVCRSITCTGKKIGVKFKFHKLQEFYESLNIDQYQNGIVHFLNIYIFLFSLHENFKSAFMALNIAANGV